MRLTHHGVAARVLAFAATVIIGCRETSGPTTGDIEITVSTTGAFRDLDQDGYSLSIDGGPERAVASNGVLTFPDLPTGNHLVQINGLATNCSVSGTNPRSVDVGSGGKTRALAVSFLVACAAKLGSIRISTTTLGQEPDPDGYAVNVRGFQSRSISANGILTIPGIREGQVDVTLGGVSGNCTVDGNEFRTVIVGYGATVEVAFTIRCVQSGSLQVTTTTSGTHLDPDGYFVSLRPNGANSRTGGSSQALANGVVTLATLVPGKYELTLFDIMPNCHAVDLNPRGVVVASGSATQITVDVTCVAPSQLAFVAGNGASSEIYVVNSNRTDPVRLTTNSAEESEPAWSPDGSRIAFTSQRDGNSEIYVMGANGTNAVRLTNAGAVDRRPRWSPDGQKIVFVSERDGNAEIYVMKADGTSPVRITTNTANDSDPSWSPDGSRIAFSSQREGNSAIWVMNADGSGARRLTSSNGGDWEPAWSPDGTRIAFTRKFSSGDGEIFIMNADGSSLTSLTRGYEDAADPSWSPDGRKIAFSASSYYYYSTELVIVDISGTPFSSVTSLSPSYNPAWRP